MATKTNTPNKNRPCACSNFEAHTRNEDPNQIEILGTGCTRQTPRTFAQGHDAKLVSFLVAAELANLDIHSGRNSGVLRSHDGAYEAALAISDALGVKAERAINTQLAKIAKAEARRAEKANRAAERAALAQAKADGKRQQAEDAAEEPTIDELIEQVDEAIDVADGWIGATETATAEPAVVRIKVGRWEYDAILNDDWSATYTSKSDQVITVDKDAYTLL